MLDIAKDILRECLFERNNKRYLLLFKFLSSDYDGVVLRYHCFKNHTCQMIAADHSMFLGSSKKKKQLCYTQILRLKLTKILAKNMKSNECKKIGMRTQVS